MQNSGRDYAIGVALIVLCAAAVVFLSGSTAVFTAIAGAIGGALFIIKGVQASNQASNQTGIQPGYQPGGYDPLNTDIPDSGVDWDAEYKRNWG
ncbi:hypothetical protein HMPREF3104_04680 [Corynebacterium sp. HMSC30G07]|uniref:hypothetical protein n=1 Tax=Corynebacterium sp. HMSC30G07 TaxID=1581072 RepID=UPI0008A5A9B4|nr:hypothetical protein [Corynebacterium sp. HMSC30G07]OFT76660.1 hypothetical protein HMPREF3104_04680 [Corynebacterium sp. HMSC30G07]